MPAAAQARAKLAERPGPAPMITARSFRFDPVMEFLSFANGLSVAVPAVAAKVAKPQGCQPSGKDGSGSADSEASASRG
jgi:hypothetical protein